MPYGSHALPAARFLLGACLYGSACDLCPPQPALTPTSSLVGGAITGGQPDEMNQILPAMPQDRSGCWFQPRVRPTDRVDDEEVVTVVGASCEPATLAQGLHVEIAVRDSRDSRVTEPLDLESASYSVLVRDEACGGHAPILVADVVVQQAVGGSAPYPDIVTDDFYRLIDLSVVLMASCAAAGHEYSIAMRYEQQADDYRRGGCKER